MAKSRFIISILFLIFCNTWKNQSIKNSNFHKIEKKLPYTSDSLNKYVSYITTILETGGYKFPDHEIFRKQVLSYYSVDIDTCKYADYVVGRERNDKKNFTECIFINERFVSTYETWEWFDTTVYKDGKPSKEEDNYLVNYNKLIFNKDLNAMANMMHKDSSYLYTVVANTGFYLNEAMLKTAINSIQSNSVREQTLALIFDQSKPEYQKLRLGILKKISEYKPDIIFDLCNNFPKGYKIFGLNKLSISEENEIMGHLLEEDILCTMRQDGQKNIYRTADVNIYFDTNPGYLSVLKFNNYYNLPELKEAALNYIPQQQRDAGSDPNYGYIVDKDGYTNLRSSANANSKIIIKIKTGAKVQILGYENNWVHIATDEGQTGYIYENRLK